MEGDVPPQNHGASSGAAPVPDPAGARVPALRLLAQPTPFIGRERQVAEVCALLDRPAVRLLTLTGPGGIGKTRLAMAAAEAVRGDFPEGVCYISLTALTNPDLVLPAIAQELGVYEVSSSGGRAVMMERLQNLIDHRKMLLVLDNFEQVIGAATDVAELLSGCARLKVLVTSREVLRIAAEHRYPVPSLALPDLQHLPPAAFLTRVEAVRLFVARAQAVQPDFSVTPENGPIVAAICHRLDGLPLAIELAAARVRLMPLVGMLARLERRLPLLTGGARDAPARHRTLRAAIDWSYDLLDPDEQRLFRRLAVFVGGCTLEAAEAICGEAGGEQAAVDEDSAQFLEALASLVDKSLLRHEGPRQSHTESEQGRFYMLETIREYALEQLAASGEAEAVRPAHARYYLALAEQAEPMLIGPHQPYWLARLEDEHDNLRAALAWALVDGKPEIGARLAAALWRFWFTRGHLGEGRRWLETVLAAGPSLPPELRARALNGAGRLALRQGDDASAQAILEESLALWRAAPGWSAGRLERGEMQTLHGLGLVAIYRGDFVQAQHYFEQNLNGWRALDDKLGTAQTLNNLGLALRYQDKFEPATAVFEECLALTREMQDRYGVAAVLHNLGQMAHHSGDDARAHRLLSESLEIGRQIGDRPNNSARLADLAAVWAAQGQPERAARIFGAAEVLRETTGANMYGGQRMVYRQDVEQAAAQMDDAAWRAAWAEGRAMPLDDAYALALEEVPIAASPPEVQPSSAPANPYGLSDREIEVLRLLAGGLTYAQIGEQLMLSYHTVHAHLRSIYPKLGVASRTQAARFAREHGLA